MNHIYYNQQSPAHNIYDDQLMSDESQDSGPASLEYRFPT